MTWIAPLLALSALALASPIAAQDEDDSPEPDPVAAAQDTPIIVTGERAEERPSQQTGSRVARKPRFTNENIRSSTGIAGLTPGSGMRPLSGRNPVFKKRITKCVSDTEGLSERATCLLVKAKQTIADGETALGADTYRYVASSDEFSAEDRLAGGQLLYALGEEFGDDALREEALIRLLEADALPASQAKPARRTLVSMALKRKDKALAIDRLEDVAATDPTDAKSLANLAILLRAEGRDGADARMAEAIIAREAKGLKAPKAWRDFVAVAE